MSKFRDLVESIIVSEEAPFWTFGEDTLEEATQISKLAKDFNSTIENELVKARYGCTIKQDGEGRHPYKRDEIASYYYTIITHYPYKFDDYKINMEIRVRYRISTHDKPEVDRKIDLYIPNFSFPKKWSKDGKVEEYDINDDTRPKYVRQGRVDFIRKLNEKIDRYKTKLDKIKADPKIQADLINLSSQNVIAKYPDLYSIYFQPWFTAWLNHMKEKNTALNLQRLSAVRS